MTDLIVRVKCAPGVSPPKYAKDGDSGADLALAIAEPVALAPGEGRWFPTGLCFEIPRGWEGQVRPRSSTHALDLEVGLGTVDSGYRGDVRIFVRNKRRRSEWAGEFGPDIVIQPGQRLAQIVFAPVGRANFPVEELGASERGDKGFGSTNMGPKPWIMRCTFKHTEPHRTCILDFGHRGDHFEGNNE
jgi:dUTP pyrophosphatase